MINTQDNEMIPGGLGIKKKACKDIVVMCEAFRIKVKEIVGEEFVLFEPICYRCQIVNGLNYFIKIQVTEEKYIHIRIHKSLEEKITFIRHQYPKKEEDEIVYF